MNFNDVLLRIYTEAPLQRKKLEKYLSSMPDSFFDEANQFVKDYSSYLESQNLSFDFAIESYLKMCKDMVKSQIYFMKNKKYPLDDQNQAYEEVYNSKKEMEPFMVGLALSQYLWKTHYQIFKHLKEILDRKRENIRRYLEIGPGHGLFLKEAINIIGSNCNYTAIDISKISLDLTKSIISFHKLGGYEVDYIHDDMLNIDSKDIYDFIVMGEVLEHVEEPTHLLNKLNTLLEDQGHAFISTCVDCPTIDHVYHFKSIEEIREMLKLCQFEIVSEKILPVEELPMDEIIERKITINYSAVIKRNN